MTDNPSNSPWSPYAPTADAPWNVARVVHLHRRAAFAAPWKVIERDLADGLEASIARVLNGEASADETSAREFESLAKTIGDAAQASNHPDRLKAWWIYRMLFSPRPLEERLTLMWHNHFATSNRKVKNLSPMREQNELFRTHARGNFAELLTAVVKHPAMLVWLDADSNRKGAANENLARELMELFTLGVGNYSEEDVKEAARALTGWAISDDAFRFAAARHDDGEVSLLGATRSMNGDDLLKVLVQQPATSRRIAWRICKTCFGENVVEEAALAELADGLRKNDLNIGWAVETVLRSRLFFSEPNLRSRILSPVQFIVGAFRALDLASPPPSTLLLAEWATRMGEDLFYPPNVGGWPEGRAWLASRSILARANFAAALVEGKLWSTPRPPDFAKLLPSKVTTSDPRDQAAWLAELLWGSAPADSVSRAVAAAENSASDKKRSAVALALLSDHESHLG